MSCRALMLLFLLLLTVQGVAMSTGDGFTLTPGGVHYHELQPGNGLVAETGDVATIHFRVWLARSGTQGQPFIESRSEDKSVSFIVGTDRILQGWNETVAGMRVGGKRLARIPSALAYGDHGVSGVVPPGSDLIFEIELLAVEKAAAR